MFMNTITTSKLHQLLENDPVYLFGTGFVSRMFCEALGDKRKYLTACLVSVRNPEKEQLFKQSWPEMTVLALSEDPVLEKNAPVLLAVHESLKEEVGEILEQNGFSNLFWIYPNVHDLVFDEIIEETLLPVADILNHQPENEFWIETRYLAIKDYFESKIEDRNLYEKGMRLFSNPDTVKARAQQVGVLAESMKAYGFLKEYPVLLDEQYRMIDGLHRLSLASYLGMKEIPCRIVRSSAQYEKIIPDNVRETDCVLKESGFSGSDFELLYKARKEMRSDPKVTLVLPAYNVAGYMDQCMESIVGQTCSELEVILINDGSSDDTGCVCRKWELRDPRIRFIDQENKGVSACRNLGVLLARGEYTGFIDPDDWVEADYVNTLYQTALDNTADYVECDIFRYNERTKKEVRRSVYGKMGIPYTLEEHMKYAPTASYKSLFKKTLWTDHKIQMPPCAFESPAVYSLVLALAKKVVNVKRPLYHYRVGRAGSLIEVGYAAKDGSANNTLGTEAMEYLLSEFQRVGLYDTFKKTLEELVKYRLSDILATQFTRKLPEDYKETVQNFKACIGKLFPESREFNYLNISGYNLNRTLVYLDNLHDPSCRFNFSSVIAIADTICRETNNQDAFPAFTHSNRYRKMMIERELKGCFFDILKEKKPEYLFLDFIEERFDILNWNGRLFTLSDALEGADPAWLQSAERISRSSEVCTELWEKSFLSFKQEVSHWSKATKIVIVENYLSEKLGDAAEQREFDEIGEIRKMNQILSVYYDYCRTHFPDIIFVPAYTANLYFTDQDYEYGAVPSHLNEIVNKTIAKMIADRI